jgi:hypothetical protein
VPSYQPARQGRPGIDRHGQRQILGKPAAEAEDPRRLVADIDDQVIGHRRTSISGESWCQSGNLASSNARIASHQAADDSASQQSWHRVPPSLDGQLS